LRACSLIARSVDRRPGRIAAVVVASLVVACASAVATAEPLGSHFEFTQFGGYTQFSADRNHLTPYDLKDGLYLGGRFGWHAERWLGFEVAGGFTPTKEDAPAAVEMDFYHFSGNLLLRPLRASWGWPYVSAGAGISRLKYSGGGPQDSQGNVEPAAGFQFWMNDAIGLRLEARDIVWLPKNDLTNPVSHDWVFGGGLTFALGARPRDTDGDGVPDRLDVCPATPHGARVDTKGCPLDVDGDHVFDGLDRCPDTPRGCVVDATGCSVDADLDGVCDGLDRCADTPKGANVDSVGCPIDSDGDGVFDGLDQCAGTPKGAKVDAAGCPVDSDGDGVADGIDQCPDTPKNLRVDATGCPIEITEKETELLDTGMIRLENVQFETGKAVLADSAKAVLDIVGHVLVKWPELKIEIGGHTDSRGSVKLNQTLSEARVKSVLEYLLERFPQLKPEQYVTKGYGKSKPIVPNVSPEAMARNRRVEFVVLNKEVLRREIERRKLLEKSEGTK
jgi:OOP family OmpA-OmpF porin